MRKIAIFVFLSVAAVAAPEAPLSALYKPTFLWKERSVTVGRGFLASFDLHDRSAVLFISCYHVLGDQPDGVLGVAAVSAEGQPRLISSSRYLKTPGQAPVSETKAQGELTVFEIERVPKGTSRLRLSGRLPKRNDVVYLFAQAYGDPAPRLYRAKIRIAVPAYLEYIFDDPKIELGGTSGGPLLDERGFVVGINVSGAALDGELHGYANPMASVIDVIRDVLASPST